MDAFAGGMERGYVATYLGHHYTGFDVRKEQIDFNINNCNLKNKPNWIHASSQKMLEYIQEQSQDFILSCPPYANLEVYSDLDDDISNKDYNEFIKIYSDIIQKCYLALKEDRFCCWVIGEIRNKKGVYYNFVGDTIKHFIEAGFKYYNEIILLTSLGSNCLRINSSFVNRKVVKSHQNILVFYKGDVKRIKENFKNLSFNDVSDDN